MPITAVTEFLSEPLVRSMKVVLPVPSVPNMYLRHSTAFPPLTREPSCESVDPLKPSVLHSEKKVSEMAGALGNHVFHRQMSKIDVTMMEIINRYTQQVCEVWFHIEPTQSNLNSNILIQLVIVWNHSRWSWNVWNRNLLMFCLLVSASTPLGAAIEFTDVKPEFCVVWSKISFEKRPCESACEKTMHAKKNSSCLIPWWSDASNRLRCHEATTSRIPSRRGYKMSWNQLVLKLVPVLVILCEQNCDALTLPS